MTNNDFILARNSGTSPVKLFFDKSLEFVKTKMQTKPVYIRRINRINPSLYPIMAILTILEAEIDFVC